MGLVQCVLFGWLYGGVVAIWLYNGVDFVDSFCETAPNTLGDGVKMPPPDERTVPLLRYVGVRPFYGELGSDDTTHDSRRVSRRGARFLV